jgi:hypothetical protein
MPTLRLGDAERAEIKDAFRRVANRANNNKQFPLSEEDFPEFGYSLLEDRTRRHYEWLRDEAEDLTSAATWNPEFCIRDSEYLYGITLHGKPELPKEKLLLTEGHAMHPPILKWVQEQYAIEDQVSESMYYLSHIVANCLSTGQIKRVLQEEILRFLPKYMHQTFEGAERQSRIPRGLEYSKEKLEALANILALGSISPEERVGIDTTIDRTEI